MKDYEKEIIQKYGLASVLEREGTVEFWNPKKGFGFIRLHPNIGSNVCCIRSTLKLSGHEDNLSVGQRVFVRYVEGSHFATATVIGIKKLEPWPCYEGKVISFDVLKGFGFIEVHKRGYGNVFVSNSLLKSVNILPGDIYKKEVIVQVGPGREAGKTQAVSLKLI